MESSTPHIIPWELIGLCLQNENSPAQAEELKAWREAAPENEARYQEAERLWLMTGKIGTDVRFDSQADWPSVARQIAPQVRQARWRMTPMRWAAAIAILLTTAVLLRWAVQEPQIVWQEAIAMQDSREVLLEDGSRIVLREGSSLRYPEVFGSGAREVELEGEAWFEIAKDRLHPFEIQGPSLNVTVLGTSFAIRDLPDDSVAQVDVATGLVRVVAGDSLLLTAGESAARQADQLNSIEQNPHFLAWQLGELSFEEASISEVLPALSRYYQTEFRLEGELADARLTASFRDEPIDDVLEVLRITLGLEAVVSPHAIELRTD